MLHAITACLLVALERSAERCERDLIGAAAHVAAADEDVERRQFADHLREDVAQLGAIGHAIDERHVLRLHRRPVEAVHAAIIEVIALEPPRLREHLAPLVARIESERPVGKRHLVLRRVRRRLGGNVEDEKILPLPHEDLLPVHRQFVGVDVVHERLDAGCFVLDGERLQRSAR